MANKISVVLDVVTDKAVSGLKGFKQSVTDADGAVGKFKAGAGSAFDSVKGAAGGLALGAGAALVTFGVKAVGAFQDTALAAGKFADATGLSTEAASRWVAVADDIGISGEAMEKSFGKLGQSIGKNNPLLEEYGITVQKGADGQADMNATMLNAIDVIKGIQDPTKKAAVAQAALGKGWMEMAELIEQGSGSLTESMADVSESQVIDPEEVEKARKMRESMDNLQDSVQDLALALGEQLVPTVSMLADGLTALITPLMKVNQWSQDVATSFGEMIGIIDEQKDAIDPLVYGYGHLITVLDQTTDSTGFVEKVMTGLNKAVEQGTASLATSTLAHWDATEAAEALAKADEEAAEEQKRAKEAADDYNRVLQDQRDATNDLVAAKTALVGGDIAVRDAQRDAAEAVGALNKLTDEGKTGTEEFAVAQDDAATAMLAAAKAAADEQIAVAEAGGAVVGAKDANQIYKEKLIELASTLAPGSPLLVQIWGYIDALNNIPKDVNTTVNLINDTRFGGPQAAGGPVQGNTAYLVGEQGPELFMPSSNGTIVPNGALGGSNGGALGGAAISVVVNAGMGADGREIGDIIVGKIREYERRNGNGWRG